MSTKAPGLAWLLTALACFLAGMAVTEGRGRAAALATLPPVGVVVTVEVAYPPAAAPPTPTPSPAPTAVPTLDPWMPLDRLPTPACDPTVVDGAWPLLRDRRSRGP